MPNATIRTCIRSVIQNYMDPISAHHHNTEKVLLVPNPGIAAMYYLG